MSSYSSQMVYIIDQKKKKSGLLLHNEFFFPLEGDNEKYVKLGRINSHI